MPRDFSIIASKQMNKHDDFVNRGEPQKAQNTITDISATLDSMDHPYFAQKNLILSISANIGVFWFFCTCRD
jgi:hypothetical protein